MRKRRISIICGVVCATIIGGVTITNSSNLFAKDGTEKEYALYEAEEWENQNGDISYPVTASSKEWEEFETHDEMVAACNLPEELLKKMSTEELVELMLDYPLMGDLLLYDDVYTGFLALSENSNVLKEILEREDGATVLLDAYCNLDMMQENKLVDKMLEECEENENAYIDIVEDDKYTATIEEMHEGITENVFLESALAQEEVIDNLNENEIEILSKEAVEKVDEKVNSEIYSSYATTIYDVAEKTECIDELGATIVEKEKTKNGKKVVANQYVTYVRTPNGSQVQVYVNDYYGLAGVIDDTNYVRKYYPKAELVGVATNMYNCHSYAWYSQSTNNIYWMNNPAKYMNDGSYKKVGTTPTAKGQKVCYTLYALNNPFIHSGVVQSISGNTIKIKSKWGSCPLVIHNVNYSPYSGTPIYYKKK